MVIIMIIRHASINTVDPDVWLFPFPAGGKWAKCQKPARNRNTNFGKLAVLT